ncbi:hypothetical protein EDC96DRAFT_561877 [Choanephora cucurbitarum]|nr:hypothetical protein EDC96DRAFT_561877 [Choanephora cucurbitarum]
MVRLNNGRFTLQKKRCIVAFWPLKRIRLYRSIMFGAEMLMRGLTGIAVHSPHEKHSNLRSGIFIKVLFERHSIPRRKGLQQRLCLKGCGIHLTLKNGYGSLLATWLGFPFLRGALTCKTSRKKKGFLAYCCIFIKYTLSNFLFIWYVACLRDLVEEEKLHLYYLKSLISGDLCKDMSFTVTKLSSLETTGLLYETISTSSFLSATFLVNHRRDILANMLIHFEGQEKEKTFMMDLIAKNGLFKACNLVKKT